MADAHKAGQGAQRITRWLVENRAEFEGQGIAEDKLAASLGMAGAEVIEAIDHLEAREEVVRIPKALSNPPQFLLKPGRGWPEARDEILAGAR
ncbi:MAG TPA: hypothetical protein VG148_00900 [Pyrinomonadaceae bacterium]|nr:hypothetical protein [Pyrinomonadaceae bacterium]